MAEHLKIFNTVSEYDAVVGTENEPTVSHVIESNGVEFKEPDPYCGHEYVDLGLPSGTKWAKTNIGASSETEYGIYYDYGKGKRDYIMTSGETAYTGTENPLASSADTATLLWGSKWHIPTRVQFQELTANTNCELLSNGYKFINKNDSSKYIILPYSGYYQRGSSSLLATGSRGIYISSNSFYYNEVVPYMLEFVKYSMWNNGCNSGYSDRITPIRPVTQ